MVTFRRLPLCLSMFPERWLLSASLAKAISVRVTCVWGKKRAMPIQDSFSEAAPMIAQDNSNRVSIALAVSNKLAGGIPDGM